MMAFSFLILEDEVDFVRRLEDTIESIDLLGKKYTTSNVNEAFEIAQQVNIDVFIVSTSLENSNGLTGVDFIKAVREIHKLTPIIVVSSSLEMRQIIDCFNELKVFAYIDKCFNAERIKIELEKAIEVSKLSNNRTISVKKKNEIKVYPTRNILCIQRMPHGKKKIWVSSYNDTFNKITTEEFLIRSSLGEILDLLENHKDIIRVHQSFLINPNFVKDISILKEELTLASNIKVPIGSTFREKVSSFIR